MSRDEELALLDKFTNALANDKSAYSLISSELLIDRKDNSIVKGCIFASKTKTYTIAISPDCSLMGDISKTPLSLINLICRNLEVASQMDTPL